MFFNEIKWDRKLKVSTMFPDYTGISKTNFGYDPTPYNVLEELVRRGWLKEEDVLLDYGCGKGRVGFFLNNQVGCSIIGLDHNKGRLKSAAANLENYGDNGRIRFVESKAEDFNPVEANCFYFFNPFSVRIFQKVLKRIKDSHREKPREIFIFFYYPTRTYRNYFKSEESLELLDVLSFKRLFINTQTSRLLVFRLKNSY